MPLRQSLRYLGWDFQSWPGLNLHAFRQKNVFLTEQLQMVIVFPPISTVQSPFFRFKGKTLPLNVKKYGLGTLVPVKV